MVHAHQFEDKWIPTDRFACRILCESEIRDCNRRLADDIAPALFGRRVTLVSLGEGAKHAFSDLTRERAFKQVRSRDLHVRAKGYNGVTPVQLRHNADAVLAGTCEYNDTDVFVLIDEVRHTGRTMYEMAEYFRQRFPRAAVKTVCLIDRPDCLTRNSRYDQPLDYTGFRITHNPEGQADPARHNRQGWLVGYGMDLQDYFRNCPSVWWSMVIPGDRATGRDDVFLKPRADELPVVEIPGHGPLRHDPPDRKPNGRKGG